jgi:hypothetical protein
MAHLNATVTGPGRRGQTAAPARCRIRASVVTVSSFAAAP